MRKKQEKQKKQKKGQKGKTKKRQKLKMLPTLRERRHYLVLLAQTQGKTKNIHTQTIQNIQNIINKAILDFIGILGYAKAGPLFIEQGKTSTKQFYFILSVVTKHVDAIKAAITLTNNIKCIGVSGTLKKSKRFLKV